MFSFPHPGSRGWGGGLEHSGRRHLFEEWLVDLLPCGRLTSRVEILHVTDELGDIVEECLEFPFVGLDHLLLERLEGVVRVDEGRDVRNNWLLMVSQMFPRFFLLPCLLQGPLSQQDVNVNPDSNFQGVRVEVRRREDRLPVRCLEVVKRLPGVVEASSVQGAPAFQHKKVVIGKPDLSGKLSGIFSR